MPSLLRGFSAPVKLDAGYSDDDLARADGPRHRRLHPLGRRPAARSATCCWHWLRDHAEAARRGLDPRLAPPRSPPVLDRAPEDPRPRRPRPVAAQQHLSRPADGGDRRRRASPRAPTMPAASSARALRDRWLAAYRANAADGPFSIETAAIGPPLPQEPGAGLPRLGRRPARRRTWPAASRRGRQHDRQPRALRLHRRDRPRPTASGAGRLLRRAGSTSRWS